ncbi:MAG: TfoX/Sxy family protein [Hyphomicrobium sp.]|nr:TfoX/Sxy family protein [Hyphomicrobium sp.]
MAVSQAFLDMIHESLAPLGALSARRMFGGASLYCDGILFALVDDDVLYLKADASSKARFERRTRPHSP